MIKNISLKSSGQFSNLVCNYQDNDAALREFYVHRPELEAYAQAIENKKSFPKENRNTLVNVLKKTYSNFGMDLNNFELVKQNIDSLSDENTFTVTTGHQLCLLTGPQYFHIKILTTIRLTLALKAKYPDKNFVPVFWLASEDHDFAEVNHFYLFNKKFEWIKNSNEQPVGRLDLQGIEDVLTEVETLARTDEAKKILEAYTQPYRTSKTLAEATFKLAHTLFSEYGLVVIEPDNAALKALFKDVMQRDISAKKNFEIIKRTNEKLKQLHYKPQVNGREINFFHLSEKGRVLIDAETKVSQEEIQNHPENFSPNVIMRPLYQETILPNLAYVGGPGEIAYWLQLKDIFVENNIPMPVLQLRETYVFLGQGLLSKIEKTGLTLTDFLQSENELINRFIAARSVDNLSEIVNAINDNSQKLIDAIGNEDAETRSALIKWKAEQIKAVNAFAKKVLQKRKDSLESEIDKLKKLRNQLLPNGSLGERHENFLALLLNSKNFSHKNLMEIPFDTKIELKEMLVD